MIAPALIFLGSTFEQQVETATQGTGVNSRELLLGLLIVLVIGFVLFGLVFFRARKKADLEDQKRLSQMSRGLSSQSSESESSNGEKGERRRKRRRKRPHRPRNASLDETGGLPPPRSDDQLPKF